MKKYSIATALITSLLISSANSAQEGKTKKEATGPSKYWTFLQGFEKGASEKKTDNLSDISETLTDLIKVRESFKKTCSKNKDKKCRELLESYLKIEISMVDEFKKDILESSINLKTALRNLSEL
tara:strand:- start:746 stop:1120 length:375 start_codon:yes stop_codon:yes gene_type:complete